MTGDVYQNIEAMLRSRGISYRAVEHEETRTSEESARARGEDLRVGGKALVVKADDTFHLAVLSADLKLDSRALANVLDSRKLRFATPEELMNLTGLVPGSVPPFGRPILPFDLFVDKSVQRSERIAFNAGSLRKSIIMATTDYLTVCGGILADFSKE
jgi:Ala-tRNA(Pro) deacylase